MSVRGSVELAASCETNMVKAFDCSSMACAKLPVSEGNSAAISSASPSAKVTLGVFCGEAILLGGGISLTSWAGVKELPDPRVVEVPMGPLNADGLPPTPVGAPPASIAAVLSERSWSFAVM